MKKKPPNIQFCFSERIGQFTVWINGILVSRIKFIRWCAFRVQWCSCSKHQLAIEHYKLIQAKVDELNRRDQEFIRQTTLLLRP